MTQGHETRTAPSYRELSDITYLRDVHIRDDGNLLYIGNRTRHPSLWSNVGGRVREHTFGVDTAVRRYDVSADGVVGTLLVEDRTGATSIYTFAPWSEGLDGDCLISAARGVTHHAGDRPLSSDGRQLALVATKKGAPATTFVVDTRTGEQRPVWDRAGALVPIAFIDDDRILLRGMSTNLSQSMYVLGDREILCRVPPVGDRATYRLVSMDDDIYRFIVRCGEFDGLWELDTRTMRWSELLSEANDIESYAHLSSEHFLYTVNSGGWSEMRSFGDDEWLGALADGCPAGVVSQLDIKAFRDDGPTALVGLATPTHPPRYFSATRPSGAWSVLLDPWLRDEPQRGVWPRTTRIASVPSFVYEPASSSGRSGPVLLSLHGGPEEQERPSYAYNGIYQYLIARGVAVVAPNVAGSTGYGSDYQERIYGDWGGADVDDIKRVLRELDKTWGLRDRHLAFLGVSYGGFLGLSIVARLDWQFAGGVLVNSPTDLQLLGDELDARARGLADRWLGPLSQRRARNPLRQLHDYGGSLLTIFGANDQVVSPAHANRLVDRLEGRSGRVDVLRLDDAGHGFTERRTWRYVNETVCRFIENVLAVNVTDGGRGDL